MPSARGEAGSALLRHTRFTGRTAELRRLTRRLDEAGARHGGVVLLAGEPGIGKTRTIEEVAETARALGALIRWGRRDEGVAVLFPRVVAGGAPERLGDGAFLSRGHTHRSPLGYTAVQNPRT
jgi:hypothetical protein